MKIILDLVSLIIIRIVLMSENVCFNVTITFYALIVSCYDIKIDQALQKYIYVRKFPINQYIIISDFVLCTFIMTAKLLGPLGAILMLFAYITFDMIVFLNSIFLIIV